MPWSEAEKQAFKRGFGWRGSKPRWKRRGRKKWWLGDPERCQECGHFRRDHKDYRIVQMCRDDCLCKVFVALPEHDFSKDSPYDYEAYGEKPSGEAKVTQRMITGMTHSEICLRLMKWKQDHGSCRCYCHD